MGSRTRPPRTRPIRLTLAAMFVIPLACLAALWGFAASVTLGPSIQEGNYTAQYAQVGRPAQTLGVDLAQERLQSFIWLSTGRRAPRTPMDADRRVTDAAITALRTAAVAAQDVTFPAAKPPLAAFIAQVGRLPALRSAMDAGTMSALAAFEAYSNIVDVEYRFYDAAVDVPDVPLYRQSAASVQAGYALELAGREVALVSGALAAGGRMGSATRALFTQNVISQRYVIGAALAQLNPPLRAPYAQAYASPAHARFAAVENQIMAGTGRETPVPVSPAAWQATAQSFLGEFIGATNTEAVALTVGGRQLSNRLELRLALAGGAGLAAVVVSVFLLARFGRRVAHELTGLHRAARDLADERLPDVVGRLRRGENVDVTAEAPPLALPSKTTEIATIARAFSTVQRTAVEAAVGQAQLRHAVSQIVLNLARRSQSLLHRQLRMLDDMENSTEDPDGLADLFRLDHLTTRMRRHAEGLIILSGAAPGRGWRTPVPVTDVLRGAIGEIEGYVRVDLVGQPPDAITGGAVADVIHLLAELIENATSFSPPNTRVTVKADRVANGFAVEIEDRGLGIEPSELAKINERLAHPPEVDLAGSDQLGLFVVSQLAAKHKIKVSLRDSPYGGTTAIVLIPYGVVVPAGHQAIAGDSGQPAALAAANGAAPVTGAAGPAGQHRILEALLPPPGQQETTAPQPPAAPPPAPGPAAPPWSAAPPPSSGYAAPPPSPGYAAPPPASGYAAPPPAPGYAAPPPASGYAAQSASGYAAPRPASGFSGAASGPVTVPLREASADASGVVAGTHLGLPRRVRQANLAPQLRDGPPPATARPRSDDARSPEDVRATMTALQRGWQRGRTDSALPGDEPDRQPDPGASTGEGEGMR